MYEKTKVCGASFEDLSTEEMEVCDGGIFQSLSPVIAATTLPCGVGASISCIGASIYFTIN